LTVLNDLDIACSEELPSKYRQHMAVSVELPALFRVELLHSNFFRVVTSSPAVAEIADRTAFSIEQ